MENFIKLLLVVVLAPFLFLQSGCNEGKSNYKAIWAIQSNFMGKENIYCFCNDFIFVQQRTFPYKAKELPIFWLIKDREKSTYLFEKLSYFSSSIKPPFIPGGVPVIVNKLIDGGGRETTYIDKSEFSKIIDKLNFIEKNATLEVPSKVAELDDFKLLDTRK